MGDLRRQIIESPVVINKHPSGATGDGNHTSGRHAQFAQIYIGEKFVGGIQNIYWEEVGGVSFERQLGNRWNEAKPEPYEVQGSFSRFQLRGRTLRQLLASMNGNVGDVVWSEMPFDIRIHQAYQSVTGKTIFEDTWTIVRDVWVQRYRDGFNDPNSLRQEQVTFIARGVQEFGTGIRTLSQHQYMLGVSTTQKDFEKGAQVIG